MVNGGSAGGESTFFADPVGGCYPSARRGENRFELGKPLEASFALPLLPGSANIQLLIRLYTASDTPDLKIEIKVPDSTGFQIPQINDVLIPDSTF